ncbi:MAG: integrase, partial [Rhizobiales bacterium]|nr:integrase [Hyphomicrobiales bacterium]
MRPGLRPRLLRIDWGFDLPDGSRLTDPRWTWWLDDARQFLWSLQVDLPPGRERIRARTVISRFGKLRILIRWMVGEGLHGFGSLDQGAAERFLHMVGNRPGRAGKRLSSPTRHAYANLLRALYLQRRKLAI